MLRKIIHIDRELCNGCGLCVTACHEGAIELVEGKAMLVREHFCDGLGDCLPACPMNAISFEMREAPAYDEAAVLAAKGTGCSGSAPRTISRPDAPKVPLPDLSHLLKKAPELPPEDTGSRLSHWPVQLKLCPLEATAFQNADLLVAADCTAFACGNFHDTYMAGRTTIIGCPKLDGVDYSEKLTEILRRNSIRSVLVTRMEVPCCGGLERAVRRAVEDCGKDIPLEVVTLRIQDGSRR